MSWTYDFGVVQNADELRAHEPLLDLPFDVEEEAVRDHIEAVKEAAATLIESPAFDDCAVLVVASGSALPGHKAYPGKGRKETVEKYDQTFEQVRIIEQSALEGINISVTQIPPDDFEPKVVDGGSS